jgi:hypothetical protein
LLLNCELLERRDGESGEKLTVQNAGAQIHRNFLVRAGRFDLLDANPVAAGERAIWPRGHLAAR